MKIALIFLYIQLTFSFYEEFKIGYELINKFRSLYTSLSKEVNEVNNAKSSSEKEQNKEDLLDILYKIMKELSEKKR